MKMMKSYIIEDLELVEENLNSVWINLRDSLSGATAVESVILLALIADVSELGQRIRALAEAVRADQQVEGEK